MATNIKVNFMHPCDGRIVTVTLDNTMTAQEAIDELINHNFIPQSHDGYELVIKGGMRLGPNQSFVEASVEDGDSLRVLPVMTYD